MGSKAEISWKVRQQDGTRREVYARHVGNHWWFYSREKRGERWERLDHPLLEDWLQLLDGVQRRIQRRLVRPEEAQRVRSTILDRFPNAEI